MRISRNKSSFFVSVIISLLAIPIAAGEVLHVYSHRHYGVDEQVNALFKERTGIEVKIVNADADQLIERLRSEGANSPADVLITVDATRMERARSHDLLGRFETEGLDLPAAQEGLNDPDGFWYPYMIRARIIVTAQGRVKPGELLRYEDLAKPEWRGRLLIRSSTSTYNQALMASMIAANGEAQATAWARGVANNLARPPQGGDRDQIKAVAAGLADACVVNSYYLGMMLESPDASEREAARKVNAVFPNQKDRGTHANVSAIALLKHAKHRDSAHQYLKFLLSPEVQSILAKGSFEHPVNLDPEITPTHKAWGAFKVDTETFGQLSKHHDAALKAFDAARWR